MYGIDFKWCTALRGRPRREGNFGNGTAPKTVHVPLICASNPPRLRFLTSTNDHDRHLALRWLRPACILRAPGQAPAEAGMDDTLPSPAHWHGAVGGFCARRHSDVFVCELEYRGLHWGGRKCVGLEGHF